METTYNCQGYYVSTVSALSALLILLLFMLSVDRRFTSFPALLQNATVSVPSVGLQTRIPAASSNQFQAVRSFDDDRPLNITRSRNTTAVPKKIIAKRGNGGELERGLARARASILRAAVSGGSSAVFGAEGAMIYRNPGAFHQSYVEMERRFKVYVYSEGDLPIVHYGPCKDIYSIEGRFIREMEHGASRFRTWNPQLAHVYFMPFSVTLMVQYLYQPLSYNVTPLKKFAGDYVRVVSTKHPFWNRTNGADHFMLACHDWGPHASRGNPHLYNTSIRVLCNANTSEGFNPRKDVSLPEIALYGGIVYPKLLSPPPINATRPYLGFFSGGRHGPIRPLLLDHWKDRNPDLRVYEYLPKKSEYYSSMLKSKFCLCPSGYEVASPRIVEAIYSECVPVILSNHYVLPFGDVLRWEAFSVQLNVSDIPRLKEVLNSIPEERYMRLKVGLRAVRRHFELNQPAKRFDMFHMILHSVWLRRLNMRLGYL